jgi:hypothetical protein
MESVQVGAVKTTTSILWCSYLNSISRWTGDLLPHVVALPHRLPLWSRRARWLEWPTVVVLLAQFLQPLHDAVGCLPWLQPDLVSLPFASKDRFDHYRPNPTDCRQLYSALLDCHPPGPVLRPTFAETM